MGGDRFAGLGFLGLGDGSVIVDEAVERVVVGMEVGFFGLEGHCTVVPAVGDPCGSHLDGNKRVGIPYVRRVEAQDRICGSAEVAQVDLQ